MLALNRKRGERLHLRNKTTGELIEVMVVRCGPAAATIGIEADTQWEISRPERTGVTHVHTSE